MIGTDDPEYAGSMLESKMAAFQMYSYAHELADETGLPDAGVTRHEGERRAAGGGGRQGVLELLQLGRAADHPAARHARGHESSMPPWRPARCRGPLRGRR